MKKLDLNGTLWAWPRVQADTSVISTKNASRSQYKMHTTLQYLCIIILYTYNIIVLDGSQDFQSSLHSEFSIMDECDLKDDPAKRGQNR